MPPTIMIGTVSVADTDRFGGSALGFRPNCQADFRRFAFEVLICVSGKWRWPNGRIRSRVNRIGRSRLVQGTNFHPKRESGQSDRGTVQANDSTQRPRSSPSVEGNEARPKKHKTACSRLRNARRWNYYEAAGTVYIWDANLRRDLNGSDDGDASEMVVDRVCAGYRIVRATQGKGIITPISKSEGNTIDVCRPDGLGFTERPSVEPVIAPAIHRY